ncbi:ABC transporter ATP-binding protein [Megasphaera sueciensis]|uniref:ABC transporter ATP-binding protein n=1 Tax=Megasphaera sueciensis TaxID=349094 RepID=UPI003D06A619
MLLTVKNLTKTYYQYKPIQALDHISFQIDAGEIIAVIGESGSGKSTLAQCLCRFINSDEGEILFDGQDITHISEQHCKKIYSQMQMVFQNPIASFHPRKTLRKSIMAGPQNFHIHMNQSAWYQLVEEVQLNTSFLDRYPHQISGGECQRAALLRALCINPKLLVCDEVTSALDVSTQGKIADLIKNICCNHHIACLFITHDLCLARWISTKTMVLHNGRLIEKGSTEQIFINPQKDYTKKLLSSRI